MLRQAVNVINKLESEVRSKLIESLCTIYSKVQSTPLNWDTRHPVPIKRSRVYSKELFVFTCLSMLIGRNLNPKAACLKRREEKSHSRGTAEVQKPFSVSMYTSFETSLFEFEDTLDIRHRERAQSLPTPTLKKKGTNYLHKVDHPIRNKHSPIVKKLHSKQKNSHTFIPPPELLPPINRITADAPLHEQHDTSPEAKN